MAIDGRRRCQHQNQNQSQSQNENQNRVARQSSMNWTGKVFVLQPDERLHLLRFLFRFRVLFRFQLGLWLVSAAVPPDAPTPAPTTPPILLRSSLQLRNYLFFNCWPLLAGMAFGIVVAAPALPCNLDYCQWQQLYLKLANKLASLAGQKNAGDARLQPLFSTLTGGKHIFAVLLCPLWPVKAGIAFKRLFTLISHFMFVFTQWNYCATDN